MDDSKKTLEYLVAVEKLAEEILADKQSIVQLDKRRNENREAIRAIQKLKDDKCWLTIGSNIFKCATSKSLSFITKDQIQIDFDIGQLRTGLKVKMNKLRDLEYQPPVPGLMLIPLSQQESGALNKSLSLK